MDERDRVRAAARHLAEAIGRRDRETIAALLAPGFVHRTHGQAAVGAAGFLDAITSIPGDIDFVRLAELTIDLCPGGALASGTQHARLRIGGETIDDRQGFVDWFVMRGGEWRIQAAVDFPLGPSEP